MRQIRKHASSLSGTALHKAKRFGWRLPFAFVWYFGRFIRQTALLLYFRTLGSYGFRRIGKKVTIDGWVQFIWPCADISLGDYCRIGRRCVFQGSPESQISVGNRVTVNDGVFITSLFSISIGDGSSIGEYTSIRDYDHAFDCLDRSIKDQGYQGGPIQIGKDCWIGRGCMITGGVHIGEGAIIGANSVVTKDIPSFSLAVGAPARVIRQRGSKKMES